MNTTWSLYFLSFLVTLLPVFCLRSEKPVLNKVMIEKIQKLYESPLGDCLLNSGKYSKAVMDNYYNNTLSSKNFLELHHLYLTLTDKVLWSANNLYDTLEYSSIAAMTIGVLYGLYNTPIDSSKDSFQTICEKKFFGALKGYFFVLGVSLTLRELFLCFQGKDKLYGDTNLNYFVGYFVAVSILAASFIKTKKYISSKIKGFSCLKKS